MGEIQLRTLVEKGLIREVIGDDTVSITGIKHDSRRVKKGDLFLAVEGVFQDGVDYVDDAIERGAVAVLCDRPITISLPVLRTDNPLKALSQIAALLYDDPTASLQAIGITGTNGKTTITYLIESILSHVGHRPAVIGTVNFRGPQGNRPATHTTPMADDLMRLARDFVDQGSTHLILEVSSHALAMHRADGVHFQVAAFTNLTLDHLDYHGDFASYEAAKRRLFEDLQPKFAVLNIDDPLGVKLANSLKMPLFRCSNRKEVKADIRTLSWSFERQGIRAHISTPSGNIDLVSPLIGAYNLENLLIAIGCGLALRIDLEEIKKALSAATGAPGRLERIADPRQVLIAVDYAHTPDALERVLTELRKITERRMFVVFGCGGDRDTKKRPLMGKVAAELADIAILTSDNPRTESPYDILDQIEIGVREQGKNAIAKTDCGTASNGYLIEEDRRAAIRLAIAAAATGDTVLIAGKGHENYQIIGSERKPFDDCIEARRAIDTATKAV